MPGKEWLGADVVFDLDADHLRGAESLDYAGQLSLVRERVRALLDDFLFSDFGIDPARVLLVFSGGRGYHVHVQDDSFGSLTSPERRELVDYVTGAGFDARRVVATERGAPSAVPDDVEGGPGRRTSRPFSRLPAPDAPGWAGRTSRAVVALLERFDREGTDAAAAELVAAGLPPRRRSGSPGSSSTMGSGGRSATRSVSRSGRPTSPRSSSRSSSRGQRSRCRVRPTRRSPPTSTG